MTRNVLQAELVFVFAGYPGKCYTELTGVMEPNEVKFLKDCQKATCSTDGSMEIVS